MSRIGRTLDRIRGRRGPEHQEAGPPVDVPETPVPEAAKPTAKPRPPGAKSRHDHRRAAGQKLLHLDLPEWQVAIIDREAAELGVSRVGWVRALIANRLRNEPRFTREAELTLFDIHSRMRVIGHDLKTIRQRYEGDTGAEAVSVIRQIDRQRIMLEELRTALRNGFKGNLDYWETPS